MFHPDGPSLLELARQALSSTERGYDLLAPKFDVTPFRTPDSVIDAVVHTIETPVASAVDLCTGTGAALPALAERCHERIVGVDFSHGMLGQAERRIASWQRQRPAGATPAIELVHGDVFDPELARRLLQGSGFDIATCFGAFGHVLPRDEPRFARQVRSLLAPGGRFVFATAEVPPPMALGRWLAHGFNAAMRVRNAIIRPAFVMYYLTFSWPECGALLERHGFAIRVEPLRLPSPMERVLVVTATAR